MLEKRKGPRYVYQEIIGIYTYEKDFIGNGTMQNISAKGMQIFSQEELEPGKDYFFVFGFKGGKRLDISTQILDKYYKGGTVGYSTLFTKLDEVKEWTLLGYLEDIGLGKI